MELTRSPLWERVLETSPFGDLEFFPEGNNSRLIFCWIKKYIVIYKMQTLMKKVAGVLEVSVNMAHAFVPVRFRYYEPNKFSFRRWGYHDKLSWRGALPRTRSGRRLPMPEYRPTNSWSEKKAIFGQNDYIDILGDPEIHPVLISYNVPAWLRGFKGNEYQVLLRKRALLGDRMRRMSPDSFHSLKKNIKYQYSYLRYNQPQNMLPRGYSREN